MFPRELKWLLVETGRVVAGVLDEVAQIPLDRQHPALIARALACAAILDDWDNAVVWPQTLARMSALLDAIHEGADE